jgi:hypothetical protein
MLHDTLIELANEFNWKQEGVSRASILLPLVKDGVELEVVEIVSSIGYSIIAGPPSVELPNMWDGSLTGFVYDVPDGVIPFGDEMMRPARLFETHNATYRVATAVERQILKQGFPSTWILLPEDKCDSYDDLVEHILLQKEQQIFNLIEPDEEVSF